MLTYDEIDILYDDVLYTYDGDVYVSTSWKWKNKPSDITWNFDKTKQDITWNFKSKP